MNKPAQKGVLSDDTLVKKIDNYQPLDSAKKLIQQTKVLFLVGPTGAGKDSVKDRLLKTGRYYHIVSHTTRPPRINQGIPEKNGRDYYFIDGAEAVRMLDAHEFIEAKVYSGNLYGTSVAEIKTAHDQHKVAVTDLEVQGVAEYKSLDPGVIAVFLLQPDFHTWQERLQRRYGDVVDAEDYRRRLETALMELEQLLKHDYYVPVINEHLDDTVRRIEEIVESPASASNAITEVRKVARRLAAEIEQYLKTG